MESKYCTVKVKDTQCHTTAAAATFTTIGSSSSSSSSSSRSSSSYCCSHIYAAKIFIHIINK